MLTHSEEKERVDQSAIQDLVQLAYEGKGVSQVIVKILAHLEDERHPVREAAVAALGQVYSLGLVQEAHVIVQVPLDLVITEVSARLEDENEDVRSTAVSVLYYLAQNGNEGQVSAAVFTGDGSVIAAVLARLEHRCPSVRTKTVAFLDSLEFAEIAHEHEDQVIIAVAARLNDEDENVRLAVSSFLGRYPAEIRNLVAKRINL